MNKKWQPMETAPKDPTDYYQSGFAAGDLCGPLIILLIDWREGLETPRYSVSAGAWDAHWMCWRFVQDDGPNDVQPIAWQPMPEVF